MSLKLKFSYQFYILCILCIVFVCIKIPNLNIPYYWDEAWVYAPGIKAMAQNGISFLPKALPDSLSRGHPLLFFCTGAIWVKLFGGSFFSLHLFALVIAIIFLFTLFYITKELFDLPMALGVAGITLAQPIFFAQSAITLPEIFLSLWAILTIYHYVKKNRYWYFLFGILLVFTKESGAVIIIALLIYECICFFTQKITHAELKLFLQDLGIAFIPLIPYLVFLLVQHYQRGYYLYPKHIGSLNFNWNVFQEKLRRCYEMLFMKQGRAFITWSFLIIFGLLYKPIIVNKRLGIIIGLIVCIKIFYRNWTLPSWLIILCIGTCISSYYYFMHIKYKPNLKETGKFLAILFIIGVVFIPYSSVNFLLNRYLFLLIPLMILYFSYYIKASLQFSPYLPYAWATLMILIMIYNAIVCCNNTGDDSPKYIQAVKLEQIMVNYLEQQNLQKNNICCKRYITEIALKYKVAGYLSGNEIFVNVSGTFDKNTEYVLYTNIDFDPPLYNDRSDTLQHFQLVKIFELGIAQGKLFKRIL